VPSPKKVGTSINAATATRAGAAISGKLGVFCLSSVNRFIRLPFVVIIGFPFTERFQSACCMDRQTLRWLAFSLGVDAADADQAMISGMSKEYNFVFSAFLVLFFGCFFIFLPLHVIFGFIVFLVFVTCPSGRF
jgi:hypothetical protein